MSSNLTQRTMTTIYEPTYIFFNKTGQIASELIGKIILVSWVELQDLQIFVISRM